MILLIFILGMLVNPTPRQSPISYHIMRPNSDIQCDKLSDIRHISAGDVCVEAANEYAHIAALNQGNKTESYYALMGAFCRIQAAKDFQYYKFDKIAFDQAILAFSIGAVWYNTNNDPWVDQTSYKIVMIVHDMYPMVFKH